MPYDDALHASRIAEMLLDEILSPSARAVLVPVGTSTREAPFPRDVTPI